MFVFPELSKTNSLCVLLLILTCAQTKTKQKVSCKVAVVVKTPRRAVDLTLATLIAVVNSRKAVCACRRARAAMWL